MFKKALLLAAFAMLIASPVGRVWAQSTDGDHVIQVFPVVVDTSSYTQRFVLTNSSGNATTIQPRYFPGSGTPQDWLYGWLACPSISLPAKGSVSFASLRQMCPALQAGSNYGMLHLVGNDMVPFAGFSRVSNAAGSGFSVEAFAASEFTPILSRVAGLRRLAATATTPAYQTNCFIARMSELSPLYATPITVEYQLRTADDTATIGSVMTAQLTQGTFYRLLDVYAGVGAPAGDYQDSIFKVKRTSGPPGAGVISFCTVQDNTNFSADFRIGKRYDASYTAPTGDSRESRKNYSRNGDAFYSGGIASDRAYALAPGKLSSNVHVVNLRAPDFIKCSLYNTPPGGSGSLTPATGLEMRLLDFYGEVVAGGNDVTNFGRVYLGDSTNRTFGLTLPYYLQVETANESNVERPYTIWCDSGSGIGGMELVETGGPDRF